MILVSPGALLVLAVTLAACFAPNRARAPSPSGWRRQWPRHRSRIHGRDEFGATSEPSLHGPGFPWG